jgi:hypothetical protein
VPDRDKENILNFKMSLALASPHYKINWPTCSNVVLPSSPLNLENSGTIASRVRELVIVISVWFLVHMSSSFGFDAEGLM